MSALPPKADMVQHDCDVRFVPNADIGLLTRTDRQLYVVASRNHKKQQ